MCLVLHYEHPPLNFSTDISSKISTLALDWVTRWLHFWSHVDNLASTGDTWNAVRFGHAIGPAVTVLQKKISIRPIRR